MAEWNPKMYELEREIRNSFRTIKRNWESLLSQSGIYVEVIEPYCKDMEQLAKKCGLTESLLQQKIQNPMTDFSIQVLTELHKHLNWYSPQTNREAGLVPTDIQVTKDIIIKSRMQQAIDEDFNDMKKLFRRYFKSKGIDQS